MTRPAAFLSLLVLSAACAGPAAQTKLVALNEHTRGFVFAQDTSVPDGDRIACIYETDTGTNIAKRVCHRIENNAVIKTGFLFPVQICGAESLCHYDNGKGGPVNAQFK